MDYSYFEVLQEKNQILLQHLPSVFIRDQIKLIPWEERLVLVAGARGVGKTTLLLQRLNKEFGPEGLKEGLVLYTSLDDLLFEELSLEELGSSFYKQGGRYLFLDEAHKYPNWSRAIKALYDLYPDLHIVLTGSSAIEINQGQADLSRRAVEFHLPGLSFREYLNLEHGLNLPKWQLEDLLSHGTALAQEAQKQRSLLKYLSDYYQFGYFPFYQQGTQSYHQKLRQVLTQTIDIDIPAVFSVTYQAIPKIKKLISLLANRVPYKPNISKLSNQLNLSRPVLMKYLYYLEKTEVISSLSTAGKGNAKLNKPEKIHLNNTNLAHALDSNPDIGSIREAFAFNQLRNAGYQVEAAKQGDHLVNGKYLFEIGGPSKKTKQIQDLENAYLALDGILYPTKKAIPLYFFGFLY